MFDNFVAINRYELLRHAGKEGRGKAPNFRTLARFGNEPIHIVRQELDIVARAIFQNHCDPAGCTHARNCRRGETERDGPGYATQLLIQTRLDRLILFGCGFPFTPFLRADKDEGVVAGADKTEQAETDDARGRFNARCFGQNLFDLGGDGFGALQ